MATVNIWYLVIDNDNQRFCNPLKAPVSDTTDITDFSVIVQDQVKAYANLTIFAGLLDIYQCKNPPITIKMDNDELTETLDAVDFSDKSKVVAFTPAQKLLQLGLADTDMLLVRLPSNGTNGTSKRKREGETYTAKKQQRFNEERSRDIENARMAPPPSSAASMPVFRTEQQKRPVLNGRPFENSGPPVGLFHPVFNNFRAMMDEEPFYSDAATYSAAMDLVQKSAYIYENEAQRLETIVECLDEFLGISFSFEEVNGSARSIHLSCGPAAAYPAHLVGKNEIGTGQTDPFTQACFTYRNYCTADDRLIKHSYCPSILLAIAGPWFCIAGAVYVDKVIVQPLTNYVWLGGNNFDKDHLRSVAQLLTAVKRSIQDLQTYYAELAPKISRLRLNSSPTVNGFPFITQYEPAKTEFTYLSLLSPTKLIYLAFLNSDIEKKLVVKFPFRYNAEAHDILSKRGLAPTLHYASVNDSSSVMYGGRHMIVMDYVDMQFLSGPLSGIQHDRIQEAIELLHQHNFVFGDLRSPNILVDGDSTMLVDFDWCGVEGKGHYPEDMTMEDIDWHQDVGPDKLMAKEHDLYMLRKLHTEMMDNHIVVYVKSNLSTTTPEISPSRNLLLTKSKALMSSLAAQLAQQASLNTALLVDRSRRKSAESYLFTGREADQHDLESIHALGVNGLLQLALLNPSLKKFEDQLFSEYAKITDRTLLPSDANAELDLGIASFLDLLGPYVMEAPTGKILEWLVRRFRINEFNVEAVLSLFLPYHESPHFTKMLSILHIKQNSTWSFLLPFKSAAQNLPRMSLVTEMLRNSDVARFATSLLPSALKEKRSHRVLLAFNAASLHDFISRSKSIDEGTIAFLLPALLEPLQSKPPTRDAILGSYVLLAALSQKCRIVPAALTVILNAMSKCAEFVLLQQYINAILSVCEAQEELENFSETMVSSILRLENIEKELRNASVWIGVEKILNPLIPALVSRLDEDNAVSVLESLIATPKIPQAIIRRLTLTLIRSIIAAGDGTVARRLLSAIQQRHPATFQGSMDAVVQDGEFEQENVDQLRISLAVVDKIDNGSNGATNIDTVLASTNADPKVRAVAVTELLAQLSHSGLSPAETKSIHSALVARVQDTNPSVIDALYSQPKVILPVLSGDAETYIDYLSTILTSPGSKPKRSFLRAHLTFLATHFSPENPSYAATVFHKVVFPFLLFSKPRQHTAEVAWNALTTQKAIAESEWLAGCATLVTEERAKDTPDVVEKMSAINTAFSSRIARNILKSNHYAAHLDTLIAKLKDENQHTRALSYLIARALIAELSGEHRVEAAHRVLDVIDVAALEGSEDLLGDSEGSENETAFAKSVVAKPNSRSTLQRLQLATVAMLSSIPRPTNIVLNWLSNSSDVPPHKQGPRYVELIRKIYILANASSSTPVFTTGVLRSLFVSLQSDALAFLAGIWTMPSKTGGTIENLHTVALHHADAFLQAHLQENDGVDFQTVLPSLLVALQSNNKDQRNIASSCLSTLNDLAQGKFTSVYAFDTIYGESEDQLQYLDRDDSKAYLNALTQHRDHFIHDAQYIEVFHQEHLGKNKGDKKKTIEYKRRVVCFLVSHINALPLPTAQVSLLRSIKAISDGAKAEILLPTIRSLVGHKKTVAPLNDLIDLVMSCFDASVARDFNEESSALWDVYVSVMRYHFSPGAPLSSQSVIAQALQDGLFSALTMERKISVCNLLLDLGTQNADSYVASKQLLVALVEDVSLIIHILGSLQPTSDTNSQPAIKRAKTTYASEDVLPRLSLFVEVLAARSLPGSLDLISKLLFMLNRVLQSVSTPRTDVNYVEQLLMSAVENAAAKVTEIPNLSPSVIQLEILVELIRGTVTFHQALLLMANLARLAPDSVLHNVMPVFTFMGSNVFHRDDTYSFKVVQQTVDSIVPVMVASLKRSHSQQLDLYIGSKDFLKVFTDAANHIPRHRRSNFFAHLVDVLGPEDFLAPLCMLLVEKVSTRVSKRDPEDIQTSLSLPTSVFHHTSAPLQIRTLTILLNESKRLADQILKPNVTQPTFLQVSPEEASNIPLSTLLRRKSLSLIVFAGNALKRSTSGAAVSKEEFGHLISSLISLATLYDESNSENKVDEICQAARTCLSRALSIMDASDFINGVLAMTQSGDQLIQSGALELFSERLPTITEKTRQTVVPVIYRIISVVRGLLSSQVNQTLSQAACKALRSIGLSMRDGEESSLTETVPLILASIQKRNVTAAALSALSPLPSKLGPRIIPYFRQIVTEIVAIIREGGSAVPDDAYSVLHGLLNSIPTFWGTGEVTQVITLYIGHDTSKPRITNPAMLGFVKVLAKRAPSNVLLPALIDLWGSFPASLRMEMFIPYFDVLARSLRSGVRTAILEHLRALFKLFLEAYDLSPQGDSETAAILAFQELVVKLNEAAFRPLFRRLYDWAFASNTGMFLIDSLTFYSSLTFIKGLMNPYMSFLLTAFIDTLKSFSTGTSNNQLLWASVIEVLKKSLLCDDGAFWRDDRLRQISTPLIQQIPVCTSFADIEAKSSLQDCLVALVENVSDDAILKSINLEILMHTRSDDVKLRLLALTCSTKLWQAHGGKLLGLAAETTTFIAECSEDENDMVVSETFKLKDAVESVAGNLSGL
ncbi:hypothetical protein H0H93_016935 [Arthromyces matolae]|nr:hypothetical protein H0H93_016935 [Arthromyces matolae]